MLSAKHYSKNLREVLFYFPLLIIVSGFSSGCAKNAASTPSSNNSSATPTVQDTSCSSTLIDVGQKGIVTAVGRGGYSDTRLIPNSSNTAVAYADAGSLTLKLTYWNGSQFSTEIISGDGAGTFVRLAFLLNGTPLVFWAQGGNLKVAIRSAALTSSGTWSTGVIDTGTAPRAIEVSVNPLDQVGVSFLTDTAAAGKPKFLYCSAPCNSPSGFQTMTPNAYIENSTLLAAQTSTGMGWCKASDSLYYPAVTYSVTGLARYAICQNSLANCLSSANWTPQTVVATASVANKLHLDSSIVGDIPKTVSQGGAGLVTYQMGATLCTDPPGAFTAGNTIGTSTTGTQWLTLLKDALGLFHIVANESTTSVRYYNSTTSDLNGVWNSQGTIETTTLAATHGGGGDVDLSGSAIYASYGQNIAPFDLKLARVADTGVASNLVGFSKYSIDLTGGLQLSAANLQVRNVSSSATSSGRPAIAYVDYSVGAVANAKLKYAYRVGSSSTAEWDISLIPGTASPQYPSLAFDHNNMPWISYFDASSNRFFLTTNSSTDGSGAWRTYEFPALPSGAAAALPAANSTSTAMFYASGVAKPVMVVIDTNAGSKGLKSAMLNPVTGAWSSVTTIDAFTGATAASHLAIDFDTSGRIVIAYNELNVTRARYATSSDGTTWSTPLSISSINQGAGVGIRLHPTTGSPVMAYFDRPNSTVYYTPCSGTPSACVTSGWSPSAIDMTAGVSGLAAGNDQLLSTGIVFDDSGYVYLIYPRGQGSTGQLTVTTNASGSFVSTALASGANGALSGSAALNFGVSGWNVSSTRNAAGGAFSAFIGPGNWLYANSCRD